MENRKIQTESDKEFAKIKQTVQECNKEQLVQTICRGYNEWVRQTPNNKIKDILSFYNSYKFWGKLDPKESDIEMIKQRAEVLKEKWESIEKLYNRLEDYRSKFVLVSILDYWVNFSNKGIVRVKETCFKPYFDMDLINCDEQEVFVNLGLNQGDTIEKYLDTYGETCYSKIYTYETAKDNVKDLQEKFKDKKEIIIRKAGVGKEKGVMHFSGNGASAEQSLVDSENEEIEITTLDDDIKEKITFLRINMLGKEKEVISGAKEHIRNDKPKLVISIYYSNNDLADIFEMIEEMQPGYHFYLRYNGSEDFPTDYILFGVPEIG